MEIVLLFRAFYALPLLHNEKGVYTNAVYGFTNILLNILEEEKPTHILVAFDAGKTTFDISNIKNIKVDGKNTTRIIRTVSNRKRIIKCL